MPYKINKIDVHAGDIMNRPGMLARVLEALAAAGADLEFVIARQVSENTSRVFVAPLSNKKVVRAAADVGLRRAVGLYALRIEGPDKPGLGARITRAIADAGLNIRGLSAASPGKSNVCYIAFAHADEVARATKALKKLLAGRR